MHRYLSFSLGIPAIQPFTLCLGVATIAFFLSLESQIKKNTVSHEFADKIKIIVIYSAIFGAIGAAISEAFYHRLEGNIHFSGFTFYGGLVFGLISTAILSWFKKLNFIHIANILVIPLILGHAFGRIGCFLGGCCYGAPTNSIFGVIFPEESLACIQFGNQALHPTQLYESIGLFFLYMLISMIGIKNRFSVYLLTYPIIRIYIEGYRGDNRGVLFFQTLTPSIEISILLLILGISIIIRKVIFPVYQNKNTIHI